MARYIRSSRTTTSSNSLSDKLLSDLNTQANDLMAQLTKKFTQDLETQAKDLLASLATSNSGSDSNGSSTDGSSAVQNLLATALKSVLQQTHHRTNSQETSRSQEANAQFRLSQSQTLAETQATIARGDKNT